MNNNTNKELKDFIDTNLSYSAYTGNLVYTQDQHIKKKGSLAGSIHNGYVRIGIVLPSSKKTMLAHIIIWYIIHGYFPENLLDHRNGVGHDNRLDNLRETSQSCNIKNSKVRDKNIYGVTGISWHKSTRKFQVHIQAAKEKFVHLGCYNSLQKATEARYQAEKIYDYQDCKSTSSAYLCLLFHFPRHLQLSNRPQVIHDFISDLQKQPYQVKQEFISNYFKQISILKKDFRHKDFLLDADANLIST